MTDPVELALSKARRSVEKQRASARAAEDQLYSAIVDAVAAGWPHSKISEAVGLTKARVTQIAGGKARRV